MGCTASVADKKAAERAERHRNNGLPVMRYKFSMSSPIATFSFPLSQSGSPDAPLPLPNEALLPPPPAMEELGIVDERSALPVVTTTGPAGDDSRGNTSPVPESSECSSTFSDLNASGRKAKKPQITPFPLAKKNNRPKKGTSSPETALTLSPGSPEAIPALSGLVVPTVTSATSLGPGSPVNTKFRHDALECTAAPDALMQTPSDTRSPFSTSASPLEPSSVQLSPSKPPQIIAALERTVCPEPPGHTPPPPSPPGALGVHGHDGLLTAPRTNSTSVKKSTTSHSRVSVSEVLSIASDDDDDDEGIASRSSMPMCTFADSNRKTAGSSSRIRSMASKSGSSQLRTVTSKSGTMFGQSTSERSDIAMSAITMRMSLSEDQAEECRLLSGGVNASRAPLPLGNASISMGDVDSLTVAAAVAAATKGSSSPPTRTPAAGASRPAVGGNGGEVGGAGSLSMGSPGPGDTTVSARPTWREQEQENRSCPPGPSRSREDRFAAMGCTLTRPLPEVLEQECDHERSLKAPGVGGVSAHRTTAPNASCPAQGPLRATSRPGSRQHLFERLEPAHHTTDAWHGGGGGVGVDQRPGRGTDSVPGLDLSSTSLPGEAISGSVASAARRHRKQNQAEALMGASVSSDFSSQPGTPRTPGAVYSTGLSTGLATGPSPAPGTPLHQSDFQGSRAGGVSFGGGGGGGGSAARLSPGGRVMPSPQRAPTQHPLGDNTPRGAQGHGQGHALGGGSVSAMSSMGSSVMAQLSRGALNDDSDSDDGSPTPPQPLGAIPTHGQGLQRQGHGQGAEGQRHQDECVILQTNPTLQGGGIVDVLSDVHEAPGISLAPIPNQGDVDSPIASAGLRGANPKSADPRRKGPKKAPSPLVFSASTKPTGSYGSNANLTPLRTHTPQLAETFSPFSTKSEKPEKSTGVHSPGKNPGGKLGPLPPRATSPGASPSATSLGPPKSPGRVSSSGRDRSALVSAFDHPTSKESSPNSGGLGPAVGLAGARSPGHEPLVGGAGIPPATGKVTPGVGSGGNGNGALGHLGPRSLEAEPHSSSLIHGIIPSTSHSMLGSSHGSHGSLSPGTPPLNHSHGRLPESAGPASATDLTLPSRLELEAQAQAHGRCHGPEHASMPHVAHGGSPTNTTAHPTAGHGGSGNGSPEARSRSERLRRLCGESNGGCDGGGVSKSPQRSGAFESSQL